MQEQLTTLEAQLQDKEQLIAALTERLEQAAEQLDRLRRSGADKALRTGGGFPPELVEEQRQLVEDLQRAVQQWEDMQPGVLLGRVEMQLGELRDLVAGGMSGGSSTGIDRLTNAHRNGERERHTEAGDTRAPSSGSSAYEALKAGLLAEDGPTEDAHDDVTTDAEQPQSSPLPTGPEYEEQPLEDPPAAIDLESVADEVLRKAIEDRDTYIMHLLGRLRNAESRRLVRNDWAALENIPEDLRARLEVLEKQLQQTLRAAEVELSLQRAKLGREEARIRLLDEQVQKKIQRAGLSENHDGLEAAPRENSPSARWLRMLGRNKGKN